MKIVYSENYYTDIGPHVFPTEKYQLIYEKLKEEKIVNNTNLFKPRAPKKEELLKIITPEYLDDLLNVRATMRTWRSEMPVEKGIIDAQILCCEGSYLVAKLAKEDGTGFHIGGGFHHAFADHAEGFCYLNDVVYAAVKLLEDGTNKIAIIDGDLHQGNGTAKFFEDNNRVFTFSIHQENLYPKKERSNLDIGLEDSTGDKEYLQKLAFALNKIFNEFGPEFIIYLAGADPYEFDQLGALSLTIPGLIKRDEMVIGRAQKKKIPVAVVLGGGYAQKLEDTVEIHCNTARVMKRIWG